MDETIVVGPFQLTILFHKKNSICQDHLFWKKAFLRLHPAAKGSCLGTKAGTGRSTARVTSIPSALRQSKTSHVLGDTGITAFPRALRTGQDVC